MTKLEANSMPDKMTDIATKSFSARGAITLTLILCLGWIGAASWIISVSKTCPEALTGGIVARYLACRQANEIGDFLAGVFAPVAFLLLALTVYIQTKELGAQRIELQENRDVMQEQANFIGKQTEIMVRTEADRQFSMLLHMICEWVREKWYDPVPDDFGRPVDRGFLTNSMPVDDERFLIQMSARLVSAVSESARWRKLTSGNRSSEVKELTTLLKNLYVFYEELGPSRKSLLDSCAVSIVIGALNAKLAKSDPI